VRAYVRSGPVITGPQQRRTVPCPVEKKGACSVVAGLIQTGTGQHLLPRHLYQPSQATCLLLLHSPCFWLHGAFSALPDDVVLQLRYFKCTALLCVESIFFLFLFGEIPFLNLHSAIVSCALSCGFEIATSLDRWLLKKKLLSVQSVQKVREEWL
jgi:hypothetical protein